MADQPLFSTEPNTTAPAVTDTVTAPTTTNEYGVMLQGIQTPDGRQKYANVSDALTSIAPKDEHISTLESENSVLRDKMNELTARMTAAEAITSAAPTAPAAPTEPAQPAMSVDDIVNAVSNQLTAKGLEEVRVTRVNEFEAKVFAQFGPEQAKEVYNEALAKSGLSEKFVLDAEAQSPGSAWKFLGLEAVPTTQPTLPTTTRNSSATMESPRPGFYAGQAKKPKAGQRLADSAIETMARLKREGSI